MTSTCCNNQNLPQTSATPRRSFWRVVTRAPHALARATHLARQRRALATLEAHMLADIGLSRQEAHREATRPFWDAPQHWQKQR